MEPPRMRISCRRCQLRKLKCTRAQPCSSCVASGSDCTFRNDDARRRPVSRSYVVALEERIASYDTMLRNLRAASPERRQAILDNSSRDSLSYPLRTTSTPIFDYSGSSRMSTLTLQPGPQGCLSFYGPTSIYQKDCITAKCTGSSFLPSNRSFEQWQDFRLSRTLNVQEVTIHNGLSKFNFYLGAECLLVDYGLFTQDFLTHRYNNKYWSYPLVYALSSLGLRLGAQASDVKDADSLTRCAHEMLSISCLQTPHVTVVQSLFSLALVELGAANHTSGWILSGMACRMAQDLGLHEDPRFLVDEDKTISPVEDFHLRRRVYWGCYIADKMISLYLGRPVMLHESDGAVDLPERIASQTEEAHESWVNDGSASGDVDGGGLSIFIQLIGLSKIIESVLTLVFSTKMIKSPRKELVMKRITSVEELNVRLFHWHSALPEDLTWNQWTPSTQSLSPPAAILHALYHSTLISLNRHFIRPTPGFARRSQSREICIASSESIMAVIRQYRARHSLTHAPLTLVYAIVMAATAVSFALDIPDPEQGPPPSECETHMKFLLKSLKECSRVYRVAMDASARLEATLKARTQGPASHAASEALSETGQHDGPGDGDDGDSGWPFDWSSWQGLPLLGDELGGVNVTEGFDGIVGTIATEDDDDEVTLACGAAESDDAGALFDWNVTH